MVELYFIVGFLNSQLSWDIKLDPFDELVPKSWRAAGYIEQLSLQCRVEGIDEVNLYLALSTYSGKFSENDLDDLLRDIDEAKADAGKISERLDFFRRNKNFQDARRRRHERFIVKAAAQLLERRKSAKRARRVKADDAIDADHSPSKLTDHNDVENEGKARREREFNDNIILYLSALLIAKCITSGIQMPISLMKLFSDFSKTNYAPSSVDDFKYKIASAIAGDESLRAQEEKLAVIAGCTVTTVRDIKKFERKRMGDTLDELIEFIKRLKKFHADDAKQFGFLKVPPGPAAILRALTPDQPDD